MEDKNKAITPLPNDQIKIDAWFEGIIDMLKTDHLLLSTDIAPKHTKELYNLLVEGTPEQVFGDLRKKTWKFFVPTIINEYMQELKDRKVVPLKLAAGLSDSKIMIWSVINDDDENVEDALLLTEAKINSKYRGYGFSINSTILEKSDDIPAPPHYKTIIA